MRKLIVLLLFISFCGSQEAENIINDDFEAQEIIYDDFALFTPINCEGDGVGCEFLYKENANIGWRDEVKKYCNVTRINFTFEEKFKIDFIEIINFQDDKYKRSAKPKSVQFYGPLVEGMQYGGYIEAVTLKETGERQLIAISEDWPPISELLFEINSGHFTPTSVDFCGIQNIKFYGYGPQDG
tara:strand:+ start:143 stop:694 length:552 start_codon:yes stop_codon:yes gene_type:complete